MAIPNRVVGAGNTSTARNVFRVTFSQALSAAPLYQMWDNSSTFPAVDASGTTTVKEAFVGTAGNSNKPEYALVDTSSGAPISSWLPAAVTVGSANPNRMKGSTNYVTSPVVPGAGGSITFNLSAEFPSDAAVPSTSSQNILLQIQYQYTGAAPTLTYAFNDAVSGTEGTPTWTTFTPGTNGIRLVNSGTIAGTYKYTLPQSGVQSVGGTQGELWITS